MAYAIITHVHGTAKFVAHHMGAKSFASADVTDENGPSEMTRCIEPSDRHIWIEWDSKNQNGNAIAFYTVECRDGKRRKLKVDLTVHNGNKHSVQLNGIVIHKMDTDEWDVSVRKFAEWIESTTDYDIA